MANRVRPIAVSEADRHELERLQRAPSTPSGLSRRVRAVLLMGQGMSGVAIAERVGYTVVQVSRVRRRFADQGIWRAHALKPHQVSTFKFTTDPEAEAKIYDVVGLYLDPPTNAVVLSLDEKTQIQALSRTQPLLPLRSGLPARQTHDYRRNGLTSLYAALDVASGRVTATAPRSTRGRTSCAS